MALHRKAFPYNRTESYSKENILGLHSVNSLLIHYAFSARSHRYYPCVQTLYHEQSPALMTLPKHWMASANRTNDTRHGTLGFICEWERLDYLTRRPVRLLVT